MKASFLGLPQHRPWVVYWDRALYGLAVLGAAFLWGRRRARANHGTAAVLLLAIVSRCVVLALTVPLGLSQRFLIEVFPLIIALAACGAAFLGQALFTRASRLLRPA